MLAIIASKLVIRSVVIVLSSLLTFSLLSCNPTTYLEIYGTPLDTVLVQQDTFALAAGNCIGA